MVKRTINIPLYNCKVVVIFDHDINPIARKVYKKHKIEHEGEEVYAVVIYPTESIHLYYIMWSTQYLNINLFVHEITHLGGKILADRGHKNIDEDEPLAYLNGHLAEEIEKIMKKNNIEYVQKKVKVKTTPLWQSNPS